MQQLVIVTGASRGVGEAVCKELLERGAAVLGVARGAAALQHERYLHLEADLGFIEAFVGLEPELRDALERFTPDALAVVNNAGALGQVAALDRLDTYELAQTLHVNLVAPIGITGLCMRVAPELPLRVIDVSSGAATSAYPGWTVYCTSKAGLRMAGQCLAQDVAEQEHLAGRDVRVVSYAPGVVATQMQEELRSLDESSFPRRQRFVELHETGALVAPEGPAREIADLLEDPELPAWSERRFGRA